MTGLALFVLAVAILLALLFWGLARVAARADGRMAQIQAETQRQYEPNVAPLPRTEAIDVAAFLAAAAVAERGDERR